MTARFEDTDNGYKTGDHVILRSGGVWRVAETDGVRLRLREHEGDAERDMAADDEDILRKVASEKILREVIDRMGFIPVIQAPHDKARRELYEASLAMYDEIEWARVVKSVYLRGQGKTLSADEAAWGERARRYLHGEISVVLGIPMARVESHIAEAVERDPW